MKVLFTGIPGVNLDGHVEGLRKFVRESEEYAETELRLSGNIRYRCGDRPLGHEPNGAPSGWATPG